MAQPGGRELFGAPLGVAPQLQPLHGMLLRRSTDIYPKELARDIREFFNSLLGRTVRSEVARAPECETMLGKLHPDPGDEKQRTEDQDESTS